MGLSTLITTRNALETGLAYTFDVLQKQIHVFPEGLWFLTM